MKSIESALSLCIWLSAILVLSCISIEIVDKINKLEGISVNHVLQLINNELPNNCWLVLDNKEGIIFLKRENITFYQIKIVKSGGIIYVEYIRKP